VPSNSPPPAWTRGPAALAAISALWTSPAADAQVAVSLSLDTDYRHRGVSLSDSRPTVTLNLSYDQASGVYAGLSAIGADASDDDFGLLGQVGYVGYARRVGVDTVLDIGATSSKFSRSSRSTEYSDFYLGVLDKNVAFHVHYSPNYFDLGRDALYSDLNLFFSPAAGWRLSGHAGWLDYLGDGPIALNDRSDFRVAVARAFQSSELRLGVSNSEPALPRQEQTTLILGASYFF
jgi:uncharacterized protein (TIGR02001 family)